jgi:Zn ribbon nucleic-acid-binding protein
MKKEIPIKHCVKCGEPIARKPGITAGEYAKRKYCSIGCLNRGKEYYTAEQLKNFERNCVNCGYLISPKDARWAGVYPSQLPKEFCSPECRKEAKAKGRLLEKTCVYCKKPYRKNPHITMEQWYAQKYCSKSCQFPESKIYASVNIAANHDANGKYWGAYQIVLQHINRLVERGYHFAYHGNKKMPVWRKDGEGFGVQWLFDYKTGIKTFHVTQRKIVYQNYSRI